MNSAASSPPDPAWDSALVSQMKDAHLRSTALPASPVFSVCSRAAVFPPRALVISFAFCLGSTGSQAEQTEIRDRGLSLIPCGILSSPGLMMTSQPTVSWGREHPEGWMWRAGPTAAVDVVSSLAVPCWFPVL